MASNAELLAKVVQKAHEDPKFLKQLESDPKGKLKEAGVNIPDDVDVELVRDTRSKTHFVLPMDRGLGDDNIIC